MFSCVLMAHYKYMQHVLICLRLCYICGLAGATVTGHKGYKKIQELIVPQKVDSEGKFISHYIPHFYKRPKRQINSEGLPFDSFGVEGSRIIALDSVLNNMVHYMVPIRGQKHYLDLIPNLNLLSPGAIVEEHGINRIKISRFRNTMCQFSGTVREEEDSIVAMSTCYGLTGYIRTKRGYFLIEPRTSVAAPPSNATTSWSTLTDERHPHLVYQRHSYEPGENASCRTTDFSENIPVRRKRNADDHSKKDDKNNMYTTTVKSDLYLETLLVLDKEFLTHHKDADVEHYVMTLMNIAHNLFLQESLGYPVYINIVRLIRMEIQEKELDLSLLHDPNRVLENFQAWQKSINPLNDSHPNHHDLAILLSRVNIFEDKADQDLLGMTRQSGACDPKRQAILVEDVGLLTGLVIAHEIGHSLGFVHDTIPESGCNSTLPNGLASVMSPKIHINTGDWSMCTSKFMKIFVESGSAHCLQDIPNDHPFEYIDELPGIVYNGDWQCKSKFGSLSKLCDTSPTCDSLHCLVPNEGCVDTNMALADGTSCGENKWCYEGDCLQVGMRPGAVDGGWGPWSSWSKCSRTCGSGVAYSDRRCDSPKPAAGGEFCKGPKKKYMICSAEPCPLNTPSFRDIQCEKFNKWQFPEDGKFHRWKTHRILVDDPCALYCVNEHGMVANLAEKVIDGTSCLRGSRDICVAGKCVKIACDFNLDSNSVEDVCGVCHGDGTSCALKQGHKTFTAKKAVNKKTEESIKLIDVPDETQNVLVEETEPTKSKLEVRSGEGNIIYITGEELGMFDVPGSKAWLGMIHPEQETLHIPGPIENPLTIWVTLLENVTFKYSLAVKTEKRAPLFNWDFVEWSTCSTACGLGTMISIAKCVEQSSGVVEDRFCSTEKPEERVKPCDNPPCTPRWFLGEWQKCTKCGHRVVQRRIVRCVQPAVGAVNDLKFVRSSKCPEPKPEHEKSCGDNDICLKRGRRRVGHRPSKSRRINMNSTNYYGRRIYLPGKRIARQQKQETKSSEADVKRFNLETGKMDIDKIECADLKFVVKSLVETKDHKDHITEYKGNDALDELAKIEERRPKTDQI